MKNTLETRLGVFFALTLVSAFIVLELIDGADFFRKGLHIHARFNNIQDLKVGDQVKMGGYNIGRVDKLTITNNQIKVTMKLTQDAKVFTDCKASIKFVGLMGQNYVSIDFGIPNGVPVQEDSELQIAEQPDLSTLMTKLNGVATGIENVTKSFSGENFGTMLAPFTDFLKENNPKITAILGNAQSISSQIAKGEGTVGKLINDEQLYTIALNTVSNFNHTATGAQELINDAQAVAKGIKDGQGTLGKLATDDRLYVEVTAFMTNAAATVAVAKEILQKVNQGQGSVGKLINDQEFYKNARMTLQKLDKATEGLEDQGPLSLLGMAVNKLF